MTVAHDRRLPSLFLVVCLSPMMTAGCGSEAETPDFVSQMVPATGKVTLDGQPLEGVVVMFLLPERATAGELATGVTDADGNYALSTMVPGRSVENSQGAVPGQYRVILTKLVMPDGSPVPPETSDAEAEALGARQLLPPQYSDPTRTTLTATVQRGPSVNDFDLTSGR